MDEAPGFLRDRFAGWEFEVAWSYEGRITTWRLTHETETRFLKVLAGEFYPSLTDERLRLEWARDRLPVPKPLEHGREGDVEWLLTSALPGRDGTAFTDDPEVLVPLLGRGLREFHGADATGCPFDFRLDAALAHVRRRLESGRLTPDYDLHDEFRGVPFDDLVARLEERRPATEDVVVCHGDYCVPNILIHEGKVSGFVDLGELGLADRWWDVAVGAWSVTWNCGPGWEDLFYESYGVEPAPDRIEYYRLLYDLAS